MAHIEIHSAGDLTLAIIHAFEDIEHTPTGREIEKVREAIITVGRNAFNTSTIAACCIVAVIE